MSGIAGKTILITRSEEANTGLASLFEQRGAHTIALPVIRFTEPDSWEAGDAAIVNLRQYDGVIFTSANAVRFLLRRIDDTAASARDVLRTRTLYTIGEKTQEALQEAGFSGALSPDIATGEDLGAWFSGQEIAGKRFLFPKSNIAREILPNALRSRDALVDEIVVYKNEPPGRADLDRMRESLLNRTIDGVAFFSPSGLRNFVQLIGTKHLDGCIIGVIGPTTAAAAGSLGIAVDVVAPQATAESLVDAMDRHFLSLTNDRS